MSRNDSVCQFDKQDTVSSKLLAYRKWCPGVGIDEKEHQLEGVKWCMSRELVVKSDRLVRGGIIADEMGLGKTILMVACIRHNFKTNTLVVLPSALISQWVSVFQRFLGHTPFVYRGSKAKNIIVDELARFPVVVTTYGMITPTCPNKDGETFIYSKLHSVKWSRIVFDEAHHLRNRKTSVHKGACQLQADIRWMVTGTPINNKLNDIYALCEVLGISSEFTPKKKEIKRLFEIYLLRRTKEQVGIALPPIHHHLVKVPWSSESEEEIAKQIHSTMRFTRVHHNNVDQLIAHMNRSPLQALTRARQICIYPQLLHKAVRKMNLENLYNFEEIMTSSKITAVVNQVVGNRDTGKRKLIFSHYCGEIEILKNKILDVGMTVQTIDGQTKNRDKKLRVMSVVSESQFYSVCKTWMELPREMFDIINRFLASEVMIVQIQTACEGLNMQHFQEIYFTSPHWNPAIEDQAIARAHRIGQEKSVDVYRFVMDDFGDGSISFEQYCSKIQEKKREVMKIMV